MLSQKKVSRGDILTGSSSRHLDDGKVPGSVAPELESRVRATAAGVGNATDSSEATDGRSRRSDCFALSPRFPKALDEWGAGPQPELHRIARRAIPHLHGVDRKHAWAFVGLWGDALTLYGLSNWSMRIDAENLDDCLAAADAARSVMTAAGLDREGEAALDLMCRYLWASGRVSDVDLFAPPVE